MKRWMLTTALALALGLALTVPPTHVERTARAAPPAPSGEAVFKKVCSLCHGMDGSVTKTGKILGAPERLGERTAKLTVDQIKDTVTNGTKKMKPLGGKLTPEEIEAVANYAKTLSP